MFHLTIILQVAEIAACDAVGGNVWMPILGSGHWDDLCYPHAAGVLPYNW